MEIRIDTNLIQAPAHTEASELARMKFELQAEEVCEEIQLEMQS
jgi:hypothetical protein